MSVVGVLFFVISTIYLSCIFGRRPFLTVLFLSLSRGFLFLVGYVGLRLLFVVFSLALFFAAALSMALGGIFDPHYGNFFETLFGSIYLFRIFFQQTWPEETYVLYSQSLALITIEFTGVIRLQ